MFVGTIQISITLTYGTRKQVEIDKDKGMMQVQYPITYR